MIATKIKALTGAALDWAVLRFWTPDVDDPEIAQMIIETAHRGEYMKRYGLRLIEEQRITLAPCNETHDGCEWTAETAAPYERVGYGRGSSPLEAAYRAYVASQIEGDEIDVPEELL